MSPEGETWTGRTGVDIARLLVAAGYVVLFQAIVRRPLVAVFGTEAEPFVVEAAIGAAALLILLAVLAWLYQALKPLLEGVALGALDALFATSNSKPDPGATSSVRSATAATETARSVGASDAATGEAPVTEVAPAPNPAATRARTSQASTQVAPTATVTSARLRESEAATEVAQDSSADATQVRR